MNELEEMREQIDAIDKQLAELIGKRMELSQNIGNYKKKNNLPVFDAKREDEIKNKNVQIVNQRYQKEYLQIFDLILKISKNLQL